MPKKQAEPASANSRFPDGFRILKGRQEYITYVDHSSIRIWESDVAAHYDNHTHSAIEIIMPRQGVSIYQLTDKSFQVQPGEILIVPSGCPHALTETAETSRHLILFEPNPLMTLRDIPAIAAMMQEPIYLDTDTPLRAEATALLRELIACYGRREPMWNTQCYGYILRLYALLGREYLRSVSPSAQAVRHRIDSPIINSAITYINEHYMDEISLDEIAAFAGFSKYYFSRIFKSFTGYSFTDYLTRKRLNVAVDLLVRTDQPIQTVASASGFNSTATFNRVFREHKNCTPTQFRAIYGTILMPSTTASIF